MAERHGRSGHDQHRRPDGSEQGKNTHWVAPQQGVLLTVQDGRASASGSGPYWRNLH
jgi:hypothetical protein